MDDQFWGKKRSPIKEGVAHILEFQKVLQASTWPEYFSTLTSSSQQPLRIIDFRLQPTPYKKLLHAHFDICKTSVTSIQAESISLCITPHVV